MSNTTGLQPKYYAADGSPINKNWVSAPVMPCLRPGRTSTRSSTWARSPDLCFQYGELLQTRLLHLRQKNAHQWPAMFYLHTRLRLLPRQSHNPHTNAPAWSLYVNAHC